MHVGQKQSEGEALDETFNVWCPLGEDILKGVLFLFLFLPSLSLLDRGGGSAWSKRGKGRSCGHQNVCRWRHLVVSYTVLGELALGVRFQLGSAGCPTVGWIDFFLFPRRNPHHQGIWVPATGDLRLGSLRRVGGGGI